MNIVANTADVITFDVRALEKRTDNLETELHKVEDVVQHIQKDIKTLKLEAGFALALSCVSTVLSVGNTLELAGNYISIGFGKLKNLINNGYMRIEGSETEIEMAMEDAGWNLVPVEYMRSVGNTDLTPLITWINAPHVKPKFSDKYASKDDDGYNPENIYVSYATTHDLCMYYRDSLKPVFKKLVDKFDDVENDLKLRVQDSDFMEYSLNNCSATYTLDSFQITFDKAPKTGQVNLVIKAIDMVMITDHLYRVYLKFDNGKITEFLGENVESQNWASYIKAELNNNIVTFTSVTPGAIGTINNITVQSNTVLNAEYRGIKNIVYKNNLNALDERVKALEKGNGGLSTNSDVERRLAILEEKCKNITLDDDVKVQSETQTLSVEERLSILERKCANINI